ncbi:MAG: glycoside hydrolase family 76 protein [Clostridia bacterium]|nr:glycoside hydrolase family 76 protein [Clostridia bacterium]
MNNIRTTRAHEAMEAYLAKYYKEGDFEKADFWDCAEIFEILDDAYEITKEARYAELIEETYERFLKDRGSDWEYNIYNDDIMWAVIAMTRAYFLTGKEKYLNTAKHNFDKTYARAISDDLGGGLFWRADNRSKNACVEGPGAIAACLLGKATGEEAYYEKAKGLIDWTVKTLYEENGKVYDCIGLDGGVNTWSSTYNQGTFIGANVLLYLHTGNEIYKKQADAAANYTMTEMYHGGIMNNEDTGNDLIGFKGIMSRWIRLYALTFNRPEYIDWLRLNADAAYENRNSEGLMWTAFGKKTEEIYYDVFGPSAALAVLFNCI